MAHSFHHICMSSDFQRELNIWPRQHSKVQCTLGSCQAMSISMLWDANRWKGKNDGIKELLSGRQMGKYANTELFCQCIFCPHTQEEHLFLQECLSNNGLNIFIISITKREKPRYHCEPMSLLVFKIMPLTAHSWSTKQMDHDETQ